MSPAIGRWYPHCLVFQAFVCVWYFFFGRGISKTWWVSPFLGCKCPIIIQLSRLALCCQGPCLHLLFLGSACAADPPCRDLFVFGTNQIFIWGWRGWHHKVQWSLQKIPENPMDMSASNWSWNSLRVPMAFFLDIFAEILNFWISSSVAHNWELTARWEDVLMVETIHVLMWCTWQRRLCRCAWPSLAMVSVQTVQCLCQAGHLGCHPLCCDCDCICDFTGSVQHRS